MDSFLPTLNSEEPNFATHDQDDQSRHNTMEIAVPMSALFDQALSIYSEWKKATE